MTANARTERRLGRRILELLAELRTLPRTDVERFKVLKRQTERAMKDYTEATGRDALDGNVDYGYKISNI